MADVFDAMKASNPGNIPVYAHLGSNEQSRPHIYVDEVRVLQECGLPQPKKRPRRVADMITLRSQQPGIAVPCFTESEEFLLRMGELPDNYHPEYARAAP